MHPSPLRRSVIPLLIGISLCLPPRPAPAASTAPGIAADEILIGQSCPLEGPTRQLGTRMRDGALTWFNHLNMAGGVRGRKIRLITLDDGYEPAACVENTKRLIERDKVFLLFGYVGTPTAEAVLPIVSQNRIPFFAPFTGAEFLRTPPQPMVFNIRASYFQETEAMVERLVTEKGIRRIAVFHQQDAYGQTGLDGVTQALQRRQLGVLKSAAYPRNTVAVEGAVKTLLEAKPEAVILVGTYEPCAQFIRQMRRGGSQALFLNVSFVGSTTLAANLANEGLGVVCAQVVPYPFNERVPVVAEYKKLLGQFFPDMDPDFVGLEGFIAARALTRVLEAAPEPLSREGFAEAAEALSQVDLGGFPLGFSKQDHQGSDSVFFTQVGPGGFIAPLEKMTDLYPYIP
jgi:ABC-type branched-subunit amino acid transport system substrate-binding protein